MGLEYPAAKPKFTFDVTISTTPESVDMSLFRGSIVRQAAAVWI